MHRRVYMRVNFMLPAAAVSAILLVACAISTAADAPGSLNLDLDECVRMAVEVNTSVVKANYDLDRSRNGVLTSAVPLLPTARWDGDRVEFHGKESVVNGVFLTSARSYDSRFSASENVSAGAVLDVFAALADKNAVGQNVRAVRQLVIFTAKQKYFGVLRAGRLLSVKQETLDRSKKRLERAQALLDVGSGVKSDVLRAQVEASSNELDLISAGNALRLAETDLKSFLRVPDEQEMELKDVLESGESDYALEAALADASQWRPDIKLQAETVKARRLGVWGARARWVPVVGISGARNYQNPTFPKGATEVWDDYHDWEWGVSLSVNLFDGLRTFTNVRDAKIQLRSAKEDLKQTRLDAALEIKQAFYNVEEARQRVKVSEETVSLAQEELKLAEERYRLGGGTMLEQIDAQVALSEAQTSHVQALYDYLLSQADLVRAMGKD
jgi:outer membrane protein